MIPRRLAFGLVVHCRKGAKDTMNKLQSRWQRLRHLGPRRAFETLANVIEDRLFDLRFSCETSAKLHRSDYDQSLKHLEHAVPYQPARARSFRIMMQQLDLPADSVFVDVGCGMGRVLLLASRYPFKRIVGIDLSADLCSIAERNMTMLPRVGSAVPYEIHAENVTTYAFKPDENVFFLYNPFDETIMAKFIAALQNSVRQAPRPIWLIYLKPLTPARQVIDQSETFQLEKRIAYGNAKFLIYRSHGDERPSNDAASTAAADVAKVA